MTENMDIKREVNELIALYDLEPSLKDIYVEGYADKLILDDFLKKNNIDEVNIITANDIDFTAIYDQYPDIKRNNKKKLISFSDILQKQLELNHTGISIIIDRDFDDIKKSLIGNEYITYTDYNSIELYLYNEESINSYYDRVLTNFPLTAKKTIELMTPILIDKFLIRLALDLNGIFKKDDITDLCKSIKIAKDKESISFNYEKHLLKILNNIGETKKLDIYVKKIEELRKDLNNEPKINIRGHDFIHLLYTIINRIKNYIKLSEETFEKTIFLCIDFDKLSNEPLFLSLKNKYITPPLILKRGKVQ